MNAIVSEVFPSPTQRLRHVVTRLWEWSGTATAFTGAAIVALQVSWSPWGFVIMTISNVCWTVFGLRMGHRGLITLQVGFAVLNAIGISRGFGFL